MNSWAEELYLNYVLIGGAILLCSQFVLKPLFGLQNFKIYGLILWCFFELLLVTSSIYFFYSPDLNTFPEKLAEYYLTFKHVTLLMLGPYLLFVWYLGLQHKFSSFQELAQHPPSYDTKKEDEMLTLTGENNKVILAIKYDQLLYVKSSGNYLDIFYLKGNSPAKEVVRMSLKELEGKIKNPNIIKTHRSYIVNKTHIASFKRTRKGYALIVQNVPFEQLPVSSSYKNTFEDVLQLNMSH
ncbi:LytR/AlgR family response regulator transcription factor [Maribacter ulvicola]|nr:LytTR family DNA-binding domain-containing protein [Maribacter ulvicola]